LVELESSLVSGYTCFLKSCMILVSAVGLYVRGHRHGPPCVVRLAALLRWAGPIVVGRSRPLPCCPPHVVHVRANSTSRPCSGPALLLANRPPARARHSLTTVHILVCPFYVRCPTVSAPGSQSEGDPSMDSFLNPSATMAAVCVVLLWHRGATSAQFVLHTTLQASAPPPVPTSPRITRHRAPIWSLLGTGPLRPSSGHDLGCPPPVQLEPNQAHRWVCLHLPCILHHCPEPLSPTSFR
jgi:hypothetical protein